MKNLAKLAKEIKLLDMQRNCKNFIDRAISRGDIKEIDFDAIREAIHDFTLGYNYQKYTEFLELELLPKYGLIINIDGLTYDDDEIEPLQIGEAVYILEISEDGEQCLVESLITNEKHYINIDRIENFLIIITKIHLNK
jgi:hypothetical protein